MASLSHYIVFHGFLTSQVVVWDFFTIKSITIHVVRDVLPTALEGLKTLHLNNVVHRDVKLGAVVTGHRRWTAAIGWDKKGNLKRPTLFSKFMGILRGYFWRFFKNF